MEYTKFFKVKYVLIHSIFYRLAQFKKKIAWFRLLLSAAKNEPVKDFLFLGPGDPPS